jgi:hypothetical protein
MGNLHRRLCAGVAKGSFGLLVSAILLLSFLAAPAVYATGGALGCKATYEAAEKEALAAKAAGDGTAGAGGAPLTAQPGAAKFDACAAADAANLASSGSAVGAAGNSACVQAIQSALATAQSCLTSVGSTDPNSPAVASFIKAKGQQVNQICGVDTVSGVSTSQSAGQTASTFDKFMCSAKDALPWILGGAALGALGAALMGGDDEDKDNRNRNPASEPPGAPGPAGGEEEEDATTDTGNNNNTQFFPNEPYQNNDNSGDSAMQEEGPEEVSTVLTGTDQDAAEQLPDELPSNREEEDIDNVPTDGSMTVTDESGQPVDGSNNNNNENNNDVLGNANDNSSDNNNTQLNDNESSNSNGGELEIIDSNNNNAPTFGASLATVQTSTPPANTVSTAAPVLGSSGFAPNSSCTLLSTAVNTYCSVSASCLSNNSCSTDNTYQNCCGSIGQ